MPSANWAPTAVPKKWGAASPAVSVVVFISGVRWTAPDKSLTQSIHPNFVGCNVSRGSFTATFSRFIQPSLLPHSFDNRARDHVAPHFRQHVQSGDRLETGPHQQRCITRTRVRPTRPGVVRANRMRRVSDRLDIPDLAGAGVEDDAIARREFAADFSDNVRAGIRPALRLIRWDGSDFNTEVFGCLLQCCE